MSGSSIQRKGPPRGPARTRLQRWLDDNGFTSAQLEEACGLGRQSMTKIRAGGDARKRTMLRILRGARRLKGPDVQLQDLFDLDPDSAENQPERD